MSIHNCLESFKNYLLKTNSDTSFLSDNFIGLRKEDFEVLKGKEETLKYYSNITSIENIEFIPEDSHFLMFYDTNEKHYITKIRFDEKELVLSLVTEIYDESKAQVVLEVEYDGSNYNGMQKQSLMPHTTIQGQIELALKKMLNRDVNTIISSRTDARVHARGNIVQFDANGIEPKKYIYALNNILPDDIRIKDAKLRSQLFHARYDVIEKTYIYIIDTSTFSVFKNDYVYYTKVKDTQKLKEELHSIIGTHDFKAFCKGENDNTVRTIYNTDLTINGNELILTFTANGFLHNMIRFIVGALIDSVNNDKPSLLELTEKQDKNLTPKLAPASGLYLIKIKY